MMYSLFPFYEQVLKVFIALFILIDPIGNLPIFLGMTENESPNQRHKALFTALLAGLFVLVVFCVAGSLILDLFGMTMDDFRIAGGILLLIISIQTLLSGRLGGGPKKEVSVVLFGCPLLIGPGAITTTLLFLKIFNVYAVIIGIAACFVAVWFVLYFADVFYRIIGKSGALIVDKISAIIVAAIAISFIRIGLQSILHFY